MSNPQWFVEQLTNGNVEKMSGGAIPRMSLEAATGMVGGWIVETGDPTLQELDVVEKVAGKGRGLGQYTSSRRGPYDEARAKALQYGQDPNTREWQLQYFVDEYQGKHDRNGLSAIGWTKAFGDKLPQSGSAADYAKFFTDVYFRPSEPHVDRRQAHAQRLYDQLYVPPEQGRNWQNPYGQVSDKPSTGAGF